jgi:hypothetical protein
MEVMEQQWLIAFQPLIKEVSNGSTDTPPPLVGPPVHRMAPVDGNAYVPWSYERTIRWNTGCPPVHRLLVDDLPPARFSGGGPKAAGRMDPLCSP